MDDLYLLQCCGEDDLDYEIEKTEKLVDKYHKDFYQMYRFCEHLAKTYFDSQSRFEEFMIKMNTDVPIHDDLEGWMSEGVLFDDFLDLSNFIS